MLSRYLPSVSVTVWMDEFWMVMVAPGNVLPLLRSVTVPETTNWATARTGSSKAVSAENNFFNVLKNKLVKPSARQGKARSTLNFIITYPYAGIIRIRCMLGH